MTERSTLPTGIEAIDGQLLGGFETGRIHTVIGNEYIVKKFIDKFKNTVVGFEEMYEIIALGDLQLQAFMDDLPIRDIIGFLDQLAEARNQAVIITHLPFRTGVTLSELSRYSQTIIDLKQDEYYEGIIHVEFLKNRVNSKPDSPVSALMKSSIYG